MENQQQSSYNEVPPQETVKQPSKLRLTWRLVAWIGVVIVITSAVVGRFWEMKYGRYHDQELHYGVKVIDKTTEQQSKLSRESYLAHAMLLREQWRPYASQHKALLLKMLHARGDDTNTLKLVYYALPATPKAAGMPPVGVNFSHPSSSDFTWQLIDKHNASTSSQKDLGDRERLTKYDSRFSRELHEDFIQFHDISVSESMSPSLSTFTLWASGRVTETALKTQHIPGKPVFKKLAPDQVAPPFNFLK